MTQGFSEEVKEMVCEAQNSFCGNEGCLEQINSIHHKCHNTEGHRKKYPLFIHSPFNGIGLCFNCHKNKFHLFRITEKEAKMYEIYLQGLKNEK